MEVEHYEIGVDTNLILNARAMGRQTRRRCSAAKPDNEQETLRTVLPLQEKLATVTPRIRAGAGIADKIKRAVS